MAMAKRIVPKNFLKITLPAGPTYLDIRLDDFKTK